VPNSILDINQFSEQLAYGHREILIEYLNLPADAYFQARIPHAGMLPNEVLPISEFQTRDGKTLKQMLWRSDSEEISKKLNIKGVHAIGATGLYAMSNQGLDLDICKKRIEIFSNNHKWSKNPETVKEILNNRKVLYMPFHSWDGDVIEHNLKKIDFLKEHDPKRIRVSLGFLDYCDPRVRRLYSTYGWSLDCAGVRASKVFGSPAGGRNRFLYELFSIIDWADIIIADEFTTGLFYAVCLGKEIGLLPGLPTTKLEYSKHQNSENENFVQLQIRKLYPWLNGESTNSNKIYEDVASALGIDKFRSPGDLKEILPWRVEPSLRHSIN
jgi:hypothetical protein